MSDDVYAETMERARTGNAMPLKYWAFISYSHRDARVAAALQRTLEAYRLPTRLVGTRTAIGEVPRRLKPVFLDRDELQAGTDLKAIVGEALAQSRYLIVVCSPDSARSEWVNREIIEFKKLHGESRVLAIIARGEPFASRSSGREAEECFPDALRSEVTSTGFADGAQLEPIAADLRPHADGKRRATLKLIAGMVGVGADDLIQRDAKRRMRQLVGITAASLASMAAMGVLALSAVRARNEAQVQRAEAEDLLEFMLGDLRRKLVPVGRLDVLDSVGGKALAYYARQDADHLDANSLGRRARALQLLGEMREQRGQLDAALSAFRRAADMTAQLLQRAPNDGQRNFDHAQSVYWVGFLAWRRGEVRAAEQAFEQYVALARNLVRLDANNLGWQSETAYAYDNLAVVYLHTSRLPEALDLLAKERATWESIIPVRPAHAFDLANALGWTAKVYEAEGSFDRALEMQREKIRVLGTVPNAAANQQVRRSLNTINIEMARLELALGRPAAAQPLALAAVQVGQSLVAGDAQNKFWLEQLCIAHALLAEVQAATGDRGSARENARLALTESARLVSLDPTVANWQVNERGLALAAAAQVSGDDDRRMLIEQMKSYGAKVREFATADRALNRARDLIVAQVELRIGVLLAGENAPEEANAHWRAAATRMQGYADQGDLPALTLLATAKFRLGEMVEARALVQRLESSNFRHPAFADLVRMLAEGAGPSLAQP